MLSHPEIITIFNLVRPNPHSPFFSGGLYQVTDAAYENRAAAAIVGFDNRQPVCRSAHMGMTSSTPPPPFLFPRLMSLSTGLLAFSEGSMPLDP